MPCILLVLLGLTGLLASGEAPPRPTDAPAPAREAWTALFRMGDAADAGCDVATFAMAAGPAAPALLAVRLAWHGSPWPERPGQEPPHPGRWAARDRAVRLAALRDLRCAPDPASAPALLAFLAQESDGGLALAAWTTLLRCDAATALAAAGRLLDRSAADPLPAGAGAGTRRAVLRLAIEAAGAGTPAGRALLAPVCAAATGDELVDALRLLPRDGSGEDLRRSALARLLPETGAPTDAAERGALIEALRGCGALDTTLALRLAALAADERRDLACPAAERLAGAAATLSPATLASLARRAGATDDQAVRLALLGALARLDPASVPPAAGLDSPWTALARHRLALAGWPTTKDP